ncbi:MAG TPA: S41 family peptidase [Candidatus Dojkabacteria bacterium]|nr:S41 family peptidase [Candidatus Dojkabacteria bacterium]HOR05990.1 S41 family peptidase [Candidatus Dojkabacteria bacterium]HQI92607.1 S41 family peptidase [Candidatus Dojkabacteria bacterium]
MDKNKSLQKTLGLAILLVCIFVSGFISGREFQGKDILNDNKEKVDTTMYWDVWDILRSNYVDSSEISPQDMMYGSIKGLVNSYNDPATVFLTPEETEEFKATSEGKYFQGIGAELGYENGNIIVVTPLDGSPAKAAGIRAGDYILSVDDKDITAEDTVYDVVARIRGEEGTKVKLKILHKDSNKPVEVSIERKQITVASMNVEFLENKSIALFRVNRFTEASYSEWISEWNAKIQEIKDAKVNKIILDLRGNPGGFFDAAIYAADDFLQGGYTISMQQDGKGKIDKYESKDGGNLTEVKLVVLVDGGSASAAEILAGALQQADRATIVGEKTYGKGTAQNVIDLSDGSSLHITTLKWLLPNGNWLNKEEPITPDVIIEFTDEDFIAGKDPQLVEAIKQINKL